MTDYRNAMREYIAMEIQAMENLDLDSINSSINAMIDTRERGGTIYTIGNGGSAATASHMVCDFAKGASENFGGKKFKIECLCDNMPVIMAISNDISYEEVFVYQLRGKLSPEDLLIAISGSGNSENVIRAVEYARELGAPVIGLSGYDGGKLKKLASYSMHVDINDMQIAEDVHMMFDHMIMRVMGKVHDGDLTI